jgi:L-threonylcarbamoyladenylate synthase
MTSYEIISQNVVPIHLIRGAIGIILTDTIYGIVARAADSTTVERLYVAKSREKKPGTVIAASVEQLADIGIASEELQKVAHLWPNPISVVLPVHPGYLDQEVGSLAVRVVADPAVRAILEQTGPLLTSSANKPGELESHTIEEAIAYFGNTVDFYTDSGPITNRSASTIVRLKPDSSLETLRVGSIDPNRLK